jgi:hypothetical protein
VFNWFKKILGIRNDALIDGDVERRQLAQNDAVNAWQRVMGCFEQHNRNRERLDRLIIERERHDQLIIRMVLNECINKLVLDDIKSDLLDSPLHRNHNLMPIRRYNVSLKPSFNCLRKTQPHLDEENNPHGLSLGLWLIILSFIDTPFAKLFGHAPRDIGGWRAFVFCSKQKIVGSKERTLTLLRLSVCNRFFRSLLRNELYSRKFQITDANMRRQPFDISLRNNYPDISRRQNCSYPFDISRSCNQHYWRGRELELSNTVVEQKAADERGVLALKNA